MKYICLVYNEPENIAALSDSELADHISSIGRWVADLEAKNAHVFSAGLQSPSTATTVRVRDRNLLVTDGPFAETREVLGGFTIFEAHDTNEAIQIASKLDVVRIGTVEVRPLMDPTLDMPDPIDMKVARGILSSSNP